MLTDVLRLHPTKPDLWIYAAQFAMEENADMTEARSYMQRGLRFCKSSRQLWLEYARLELTYIAKIHARRQILGVAEGPGSDGKSPTNPAADSNTPLALTTEDINPSGEANGEKVDEVALEKLDSTPAMNGAIPVAVFDAAMAQFDNDPSIGHAFFDLVVSFNQIPPARSILTHLEHKLLATSPRSWHTQACHIHSPLATTAVSSPDFPTAFRESLGRLRQALQEPGDEDELTTWTQSWFGTMLEDEELDPAIRKIVQSQLGSLSKN